MKTRLLASLCLALCWASACSGPGGVGVRLDEYSLEASSEVASGDVTFSVRNVGQIPHEFDVLRTELDPDDLPVVDARVRTRGPAVALVRKTGRIKAGESATVLVRLRAGAYVLICNVPGHYQSGMRAALQAS